MARSLLALAALLLSTLAGAAADLSVEIYEVQSITVPSGNNAGADGFIVRAEPREGEKVGQSITVPDLKGVQFTIDGKEVTRAEIIEWVSDQRWPRVEVTSDPKLNNAPVKLRFYGCPPESRSRRSDK